MSPRLRQKMAVADWLNPGIARAYRKLPGLYIASAKKIARERFEAEPNAFNCSLCRLMHSK